MKRSLLWSKAASKPRIAFLYPGQGSQAVNMLAGLKSVLPDFEKHLVRLDTLQSMISDESLLDRIYTSPGREADDALRDTRHAQPALGIVETALRLSLEALGIKAEFHAGHSYGECVALCAAGFLDERLLLKLSFERGRLLAEAGRTSPGAMMALAATREQVETLRDRIDPAIEIANVNSPRQIVVSGPVEAIARLEDAVRAQGLSGKRLNTSCAFHSSLMHSVLPEWRQVLRGLLKNSSHTPAAQAFSNVTARRYAGTGDMPDLLAEHIVSPVRWDETCTNLLAAGANIFIEVGPGRVLSDLMSKNAEGQSPLILAVDPMQADPEEHFRNLLAQLAAAGLDLSVNAPVETVRAEASETSFFESNRDIIQRYFAQQTALVELAVRNATPAERSTLTQSALAANQKIMSEFLSAQEAAARAMSGGPPLQMPLQIIPQQAAQPLPSTADLPSRVEAALRTAIADATGFPTESIDRNACFSNLGLDSLTMAEIWAELANRIPEVAAFADRVYEIRSLADVSVISATPETAPPAPQPGTWNGVRAQLVEAIASATGVDVARIADTSDFERDLGFDAFKREEVFRKHLFDHPQFGQAGRALLNAHNLFELERLLERFDGANVQAVQRFVLREEPLELHKGLTNLPSAVFVAAGTPSAEVDVLSNLFADRGISVDRHASEIVFVAQNESDVTALFVLAKTLWGENSARHKPSGLTVLGSFDYGPGARGAVGVARSLRREISDAAIRTVWLESALAQTNEDLLLTALFSPHLEGDVSISANRLVRETLSQSRKPSAPRPPRRLGRASRVLVLGGGDGISAEIAVGLSSRYGCEIIAIGRTPFPDSFPYPEIESGPETAQLLKRAIIQDSSVESSTRAEAVQHRWKIVSRQRALWTTKTRVEAAGGRFSYRTGDVSDGLEFSNTIRSIRSAGPIHGIIHGAGIVADNLLPHKSVEEFRAVLRTKAVPAGLLRELFADDPLEFVFFLSSMTSYTGTAGQTDYAAANEVLNAVARDWNRAVVYPVKSLLWSVWTEAGLASPVLKRHMTKMGLDGITTAQGVALLIDELAHGSKSEDWILFAPLSTLNYSLDSPSPRQWDRHDETLARAVTT